MSKQVITTPKFGWGEEHQSAQEKLYIEAIENEKLIQTYGEESFSRPISSEETQMEKRVREIMPFDVGWDFTYASRIRHKRDIHHGPQNDGDCVGYSNSNCICYRIDHEILCRGQADEPLGDYAKGFAPMPHIGYSYGMGRYEGNMLRSGAGSYCSVQLRANKEHGFLPCDTPGIETDDPQPRTTSETKKWGSSKDLLFQWRPHAIEQTLEHSYQVKTEDDMWNAITVDKYPVQICSMWGFAARGKIQWDDYVFWEFIRRGSWPHSMSVIGAFENPQNGDRWYKIGNQWGLYHKGEWFFQVSASTMSKWVMQADARATGEVNGRESTFALAV